MNAWLYLAQRGSAAVLAPLVLVHLVTMLVAIDGGVSAQEILGRTRGSAAWATFYGLFVVAAAVHGAVGIRVVAGEWLGLRPRALDALAGAFLLAALALGARALVAIL